MNRPDILKRCAEKGVAGEAEIGSVLRLLYVQLLSAVQRGQTVEVPGFGTFGSRVAGVKKLRKIPYFEPAPDLAEKANHRFGDLRPLVVGTYHELPAFAETEFRGDTPPYDSIVDAHGKDTIIDTQTEISASSFAQLTAETQRPQHTQEESVMPRLNLKDDSLESDDLQESGQGAPPTLREVGGGGGGGLSPLVLILLIIAVLALGAFALNYFGVVHLWGGKPAQVAEPFPEPVLQEPTTLPEPGAQAPASSEPAPAIAEPAPQIAPPTRESSPAVTQAAPPPTGPGDFTIQVSSWATRAKADGEAARLSSAGFPAYVEEGAVAGTTWYRVRVGKYTSENEAKAAIAKLQPGVETDLWVARVGR